MLFQCFFCDINMETHFHAKLLKHMLLPNNER